MTDFVEVGKKDEFSVQDDCEYFLLRYPSGFDLASLDCSDIIQDSNIDTPERMLCTVTTQDHRTFYLTHAPTMPSWSLFDGSDGSLKTFSGMLSVQLQPVGNASIACVASEETKVQQPKKEKEKSKKRKSNSK